MCLLLGVAFMFQEAVYQVGEGVGSLPICVDRVSGTQSIPITFDIDSGDDSDPLTFNGKFTVALFHLAGHNTHCYEVYRFNSLMYTP